MKKNSIYLLLIAVFFASNLYAEVICVKNSKKFSVSDANKVNIKADRFLTTAGTTCPQGYTQLVEVVTPSRTYTGSWNLGGENAVYAVSAISFPVPLSSDPTNVIFVQSETNNAICTGTAEVPTAPPGVMCIYESLTYGMKGNFPSRYAAHRTTTAVVGSNAASKFGAGIFGYSAGAISFFGWGTWAVTEQ